MRQTNPKSQYTCQHCAASFPKWAGQCSSCQAWNSFVEERIPTASVHDQRQGYAGSVQAQVTACSTVQFIQESRLQSGLTELDRVLGGGLVEGSVVLIGGDPGIGKSTLLLQALASFSQKIPILYVTGEESLQQVALRARRLKLPEQGLQLLADTQVEHILECAKETNPRIIVIDSIQTMYTEALESAPGSVSQVRESAARCVAFAKQTGIALFLVGHVTKEGTLAGPRVLEHMVDTVLYFEGEKDNRFRVVRAVKNRFGAVNELGIFAMTDQGLKEVAHPSAIFLSRYTNPVAGSAVMVTWEGSRPMLVEVQALVDESYLANPRRVCVGLEQNRLSLLLAVLHRHGSVATYNQDVFVNVVGGIRITETGADLALLLAVLSSLHNRPLMRELIVFGEVGLAGEIRPVQSGQERLREAVKYGFRYAIVPTANVPKKEIDGLTIKAVDRLSDVMGHIKEIYAGVT